MAQSPFSLFIVCLTFSTAFCFTSHKTFRFTLRSLNSRKSTDFSTFHKLAKFGSVAYFSIALCGFTIPVSAVDPIELRQFATPGQESRLYGEGNLDEKLRKLKETQDALDAANIPFIELPNGVSYREYREGKGSKQIRSGSEVAVQMTIRCKSFATKDDPGGVKYFSTAKDTPGDMLSWTVGSGTLLPGLEEGMMGMKRNSVRRIEIPSVQVYKAYKNGQLPLPSPNDADGNRRLKNLFKTDATLLFEVVVTKIVDPVVSASE